MASNYTEWYFQLYNRRTGRPIDDDTGLYEVLTASDPSRLTAYSDANGTSLTQPGTMTNGVVRFFLDSSTTSCDVSILSASGQSYFLEGVTPSQHRVDVDPEKLEYTFVCRWHANTACDAVADSGFDLLAGMRVKEVFLHVPVAIATGCMIDVGISGDTDGFMDNVNAGSSTGWRVADVNLGAVGTDVAFYTTFVSAVQERGVLLAKWAGGLTTASTGAAKGFYTPIRYIVTAATSLVWVLKTTNTAGTGKGYIYVTYELLPTIGN